MGKFNICFFEDMHKIISAKEFESNNLASASWQERYEKFVLTKAYTELVEITSRQKILDSNTAKEQEKTRAIELIRQQIIGAEANPDYDYSKLKEEIEYIDELGFVKQRPKIENTLFSPDLKVNNQKLVREVSYWHAVADGFKSFGQLLMRPFNRFSAVNKLAQKIDEQTYLSETVRTGRLIDKIELYLGPNPDKTDYGVALATISKFKTAGLLHDSTFGKSETKKLLAKEQEYIDKIKSLPRSSNNSNNVPKLNFWQKLRGRFEDIGHSLNHLLFGINKPEMNYQLEKSYLKKHERLADIEITQFENGQKVSFRNNSGDKKATALLIEKGVNELQRQVSNERKNKRLRAIGKYVFFALSAGFFVLLANQLASAEDQSVPDHNHHTLDPYDKPSNEWSASGHQSTESVTNATKFDVETKTIPGQNGFGIIVDPITGEEKPMDADYLQDSNLNYFETYEPNAPSPSHLYLPDSSRDNLLLALQYNDQVGADKFLHNLDLNPDMKLAGTDQTLSNWLFANKNELVSHPKAWDWIAYHDPAHANEVLQTVTDPDYTDYHQRENMIAANVLEISSPILSEVEYSSVDNVPVTQEVEFVDFQNISTPTSSEVNFQPLDTPISAEQSFEVIQPPITNEIGFQNIDTPVTNEINFDQAHPVSQEIYFNAVKPISSEVDFHVIDTPITKEVDFQNIESKTTSETDFQEINLKHPEIIFPAELPDDMSSSQTVNPSSSEVEFDLPNTENNPVTTEVEFIIP